MLAASVLQDVRASSGLTLRALAARAETSHSTLAAYESARKRPTTQTFVRVVQAAGFAIDVELGRRHRGSDELPRGEELVQVLDLAEQFPARHESRLAFPPFGG